LKRAKLRSMYLTLAVVWTFLYYPIEALAPVITEN